MHHCCVCPELTQLFSQVHMSDTDVVIGVKRGVQRVVCKLVKLYPSLSAQTAKFWIDFGMLVTPPSI
uniref:Uncharacterized protein n=1 Tax=Anguilla anguilla TaxID=7936 RepID=A0A0E9Q682_ANGAN